MCRSQRKRDSLQWTGSLNCARSDSYFPEVREFSCAAFKCSVFVSGPCRAPGVHEIMRIYHVPRARRIGYVYPMFDDSFRVSTFLYNRATVHAWILSCPIQEFSNRRQGLCRLITTRVVFTPKPNGNVLDSRIWEVIASASRGHTGQRVNFGPCVAAPISQTTVRVSTK